MTSLQISDARIRPRPDIEIQWPRTHWSLDRISASPAGVNSNASTLSAGIPGLRISPAASKRPMAFSGTNSDLPTATQLRHSRSLESTLVGPGITTHPRHRGTVCAFVASRCACPKAYIKPGLADVDRQIMSKRDTYLKKKAAESFLDRPDWARCLQSCEISRAQKNRLSAVSLYLRISATHLLLSLIGAQGGTRTPTPYGATTSR